MTVAHKHQSTGVLVSWVQQAAFAPPSITVCIKHGRPAIRLIEVAKRFLLNVVGENATPMFKHFGKGFTLEDDAFAGLDIEPTDFGPKLSECIAHLGCEVLNKFSTGDHDIYLAKVVAAGSKPAATPYVHIRKSGLTY